MTDVVMPQMGESIVEGTLTRWLKKPGDRVERDEPLFEISTDKVDTEIPSPVAGVLAEVLVEAGKTVAINTVVARISGGAPAAAPAPAPVQAAAAPVAPVAPPPASAPRTLNTCILPTRNFHATLDPKVLSPNKLALRRPMVCHGPAVVAGIGI